MKKSFIVFGIIVTFLALTGCSREKSSAKEESHGGHGHDHGAASHENSTVTTLTAEQIKSIKIEMGSIEQKQLTASIKANGILKVPNQNKATASSLYGGIVRNILVQPGNQVKKGQVVATIANAQFILLQEEYLTVASRLELAKLEYNRQKELSAGNAGALKNLQQSEAEYNALKTRKASIRKQLELIGINTASLSNENLASTVPITSPITGSVSNILINIGSNIDVNTPIVEVVDNSQLHLDLFVYEKDLPKLKTGQTIHFTLTNNPGKEYDADIFGIGNTFEDKTKAIAVHAAVKGNKTGLIDGMNITALVSLEVITVPAVPTEAIVNHEGQDYIFIAKGTGAEAHGTSSGHHHEGHEHGPSDRDDKAGEHAAHEHGKETKLPEGSMSFEKIPVRKGTTDIGYSEITLLKDIPEGAEIVVKGAFFINAKMTNQGEAHAH